MGNQCPVCGAFGYQRIATKRGEPDAYAVCRKGHPHYVPKSFFPPALRVVL